jgi:hypothetical protein
MRATRTDTCALVFMTISVLACGQPSAVASLAVGSTPAASAVGPTRSDTPDTVPTTTGASTTTPAAISSGDAAQQPPVEFTGRIVCGPPVRIQQEDSIANGVDGSTLSRSRGGAWSQTVDMSDERLNGTVFHTFESDGYAIPGSDTGPEMWSATRRIENEHGAWEGRAIGGNFYDGTAIGSPDVPEVWIGEGAYAGLIAVMASNPVEDRCEVEVRGLIFDAETLSAPYNPQ